MSNKEEAQEVGGEFEEKYGSEAFIKVCMSTMTRLLVDKGIVTEEELRQRFIDETKVFEDAIDEALEKEDEEN